MSKHWTLMQENLYIKLHTGIVNVKKLRISLFIFLMFFLFICGTQLFAYEFHLKSDTCLGEQIILARYYGKSLYPMDTLECNSQKDIVFKNNKKIEQGLYAIIFPEKSKTDFLVAKNQKLDIHLHFNQSMQAQVTGDEQSEVFSQYSTFMIEMHKKREMHVTRYKQNAKNTDSILFIRNALNALNIQVRKYYSDNIKQFEGETLGSIFSVLLPIDAPKIFSAEEQRMYMKNHFFDHVNFNDQVLTNTPFLINQLDVYLKEIVEPVPDSLVKYSIKIIDKSMVNDAVFKQICNHVFSFATQSKIMGMDKLQVAISKRYYLSGKADWTNLEFRNKLKELVVKAEPILIGNKAPEITLLSLNEEDGFVSLKDVAAKYTLVFFWEPGCYHCQQAIPLIKNVTKSYPSSTLSVFAVYTQKEVDEWKDFIFEHDLYKWIHVYDKNYQSTVKQVYDVASTPMLYLLDEDKKIVAKKFDPKFLEPIMKQLISKNKP